MKLLFTPLFLLITMSIVAQEATVNTGKLDHVKSFPSNYVDSRTIDIWLPDGYSTS